MIWWTLFGVGMTFLTLILAGAFKKEKLPPSPTDQNDVQ